MMNLTNTNEVVLCALIALLNLGLGFAWACHKNIANQAYRDGSANGYEKGWSAGWDDCERDLAERNETQDRIGDFD